MHHILEEIPLFDGVEPNVLKTIFKHVSIEKYKRNQVIICEGGTNEHFYIVKKGDSLSSIAGRSDVYGDPLKWPILYRLNMDKLDALEAGEDFLESELSEGVMLKIITPDEAKENLERRVHNVWVVNVLSATTNGKIIPVAVRLIDNGYMTYITRAKVKGKDWTRLRVGFFKDRTEADTKGKKIMAMLNLADAWVIKVGKKELGEFGGY